MKTIILIILITFLSISSFAQSGLSFKIYQNTDFSHTRHTDNSGNVSIGFTTDKIEETKSALQKLSINATDRTEEGGQFLHFNDPDGTALYFIKPKW